MWIVLCRMVCFCFISLVTAELHAPSTLRFVHYLSILPFTFTFPKHFFVAPSSGHLHLELHTSSGHLVHVRLHLAFVSLQSLVLHVVLLPSCMLCNSVTVSSIHLFFRFHRPIVCLRSAISLSRSSSVSLSFLPTPFLPANANSW